MKTTLICTLLLLLAAAGYGYHHNPAGCAKLGRDLVAIYTSSGSTPDGSPAAPAPSTSLPATASSGTVAVVSPSVPASVEPPAPVAPPVVPVPPPQPAKAWTPPDVMPAQPNWTWTTSDGKTYQNVVVTKIEIDSVTITHSLGVAHLDSSTLPPDIQKQLNYDPVASAAAKAEKQRETEHPYYTFASFAEAQEVARQMHWPLAWIDSFISYLSVANPQPGSDEDLTQTAVNDLKTQSIVIFLDGNTDLGYIPKPVLGQFYTFDDGPMPGGHHFYPPKIVFSNPDATETFGRVSSTQMKASGTAAIDAVLSSPAMNADAGSPSNAPPATTPAP